MKKKSSENKPSLFWRIVSGTFGFGGPAFFDFLILSHKNDRLLKEIRRSVDQQRKEEEARGFYV